jgi:CHASE1-domain containing sensor protein
MTQAESKAAVSAGVQQEQLEAEERRRSVVLFLVGLAAAILVFLAGGLPSDDRDRVPRVVGV